MAPIATRHRSASAPQSTVPVSGVVRTRLTVKRPVATPSASAVAYTTEPMSQPSTPPRVSGLSPPASCAHCTMPTCSPGTKPGLEAVTVSRSSRPICGSTVTGSPMESLPSSGPRNVSVPGSGAGSLLPSSSSSRRDRSLSPFRSLRLTVMPTSRSATAATARNRRRSRGGSTAGSAASARSGFTWAATWAWRRRLAARAASSTGARVGSSGSVIRAPGRGGWPACAGRCGGGPWRCPRHSRGCRRSRRC